MQTIDNPMLRPSYADRLKERTEVALGMLHEAQVDYFLDAVCAGIDVSVPNPFGLRDNETTKVSAFLDELTEEQRGIQFRAHSAAMNGDDKTCGELMRGLVRNIADMRAAEMAKRGML